MKITHQRLFIFLAPLLAQTAVFAEPKAQPGPLILSSPATQGVGASWRASEIIGTHVKNAAEETIGEVQELAVDFVSGEVLAVVIASGGFIGMADTLSAVPASAVRYDAVTKAFKTQLTKEQLVAAPGFKKSEWPDFGEETTRSKLRAFRDSILGGRKDRADDEVMPAGQGNSESDLKTTRDIRIGIAETGLSSDAKNIKVTTKDGMVTLKGTVKNHAEHETILKIAKSHVDAAKLTDNIVMKGE